MKKITALLLLFSLLFLWGCAGDDTSKVTPSTVTPTGEDYFIYGEYESETAVEAVLAFMENKGYDITVTDRTPDTEGDIVGNMYFITVNDMDDELYHTKHYATIDVYASDLNASTALKNLYSQNYISGWDSMLRINNVTVNGKGNVLREVVTAFGLTDFKTQAVVSGKTVLSDKINLSESYQTQLREAGYTVYEKSGVQNAVIQDSLFAISANGDYGFNLFHCQKGTDIEDDFLPACYQILTSPYYVYATCKLGSEIYVLYAPVDVIDSVIALISA